MNSPLVVQPLVSCNFQVFRGQMHPYELEKHYSMDIHLQNISRTSEIHGGKTRRLVCHFHFQMFTVVEGNLPIFGQLVMAFYNLPSFFSASSWNSFATAHFNAQSTSIGVIFNLSYLSYRVSECWRVWWVAQGALCRMSLCQDTSVGCCIIHCIIIIPFSLTGIIYIFPFPSMQSSGLLPPSREVWSGRRYLQSTSCQRVLLPPFYFKRW